MKRFLFILLAKSFLVCNSQELDFGKVLDRVTCAQDSSQTYALYVPSYYSKQEKWPVIFVFEPAASGPLPVHNFADVAEKLGYIIIASNNSKNGSWNLSFEAAEAIFTDAAKRFVIDSARIYTSGFSGGSRVAVTLAVLNQNIDGVIGCGAGLSSVAEHQPGKKDKFIYVGIVGNRDMNYLEHVDLKEKFNSLGLINNLIIFNAGHQWPPPYILREAVYWLDHQSSKRGIKVSSMFSADTLLHRMKFRADSLFLDERFTQARDVYMYTILDFEGYAEIENIKNNLEDLEETKKLNKITRRQERLYERERQYQRKIDQAFFEIRFTRLKQSRDSTAKTKEWWYNESDSLQSVTLSKNIDKSNSGYRLLNLIWAKFATSSFKSEANKDYEMAIELNDVWVHADPTNVWGLWNMAKLQSLTGNKDLAIEYLTRAKKAGMKYKGSLKNEAFDILRDNPRFIALESELLVLKN